MTFHAFRIARDGAATCPVCQEADKNPVLIAYYGHCGACAMRLTRMAQRATAVLGQNDLGLRFRASWAINILAGTGATSIVTAGRALPPSRAIRTH